MLVKNNNERVVDYEAVPNGENGNVYKYDPGIGKTKEAEKGIPPHLSISVLSLSRRIMNKFVTELGGSFSKKSSIKIPALYVFICIIMKNQKKLVLLQLF